MADTGFKNPTSTGDDHNQWGSPTNAYASDDTYATQAANNYLQDYYNFTFSVPSGAAIDGIEVSFEGDTVAAYTGNMMEVDLSWNGGTSYTAVKTIVDNSNDSGDITVTLGGGTDTWGRSWSDTEFSNTNFRVRGKNINATGPWYVDHIQIKVYYTSGTSHTQSISDSFSFAISPKKSIIKPISASTDVSDIHLKLSTLQEHDAGLSVSLIDSLIHDVQKELITSCSLLDSISTSSEAYKSMLESLAISESSIKRSTLIKIDSFTFTDDIVTDHDIGIIYKNLSDSMQIIESISNGVNLIQDESISFSESSVRSVSKNISALIEFAESILSISEKTLSGEFSISSIIQKSLAKPIDDIFQFTDSQTHEKIRDILDSVSLSEAQIKAIELLHTEVCSISEDLKKQASLLLLASFGITENVAMSSTISHTELLSIIENRVFESSLSKAETTLLIDALRINNEISKSESISLIDSVLLTSEYLRSLSETLSVAEQKYTSALLTRSEAVSINDLFSISANVNLIEEIILAATATKETDKMLTNTISLLDSVLPESVYQRALISNFSLTEESFRENSKVFTSVFSLIDAIDIVTGQEVRLDETLNFLSGHPISYNDENTTYADELAQYNYHPLPIFTVGKNLTETITITEVSQTLSEFTKTFIDTCALAEVLIKQIGLTLDEAFNFIAILLPTAGREIADSVSLIESLIKEIRVNKLDSLTVAEELIKQTETHLIDAISLSEILEKFSDISFSDTISLADALHLVSGFSKSDSISFSDSLIKQISKQKIETISILESLVLTVTTRITDSINFQDDINASKIKKQNISELINLNEVLVKQLDINPSEILIIDEQMLTTTGSEKKLDDNISLQDQIEYTKDVCIDIADDIALSDLLIKTFNISQTEAFAIIGSMSSDYAVSAPRKTYMLTNQNRTMLLTRKNKTMLTSNKSKTILRTND